MRQSISRHLLPLICILFLQIGVGCDKGGGIGATSSGCIVCLTPAGTSLLVAMGLGDRIVGVSSYEADPVLRLKPKVGDYERIDWERFGELKPKMLIVQGRKDRLPPGVRERCEDAGIAISILQIDRLEDIFAAAHQLGEAVDAKPSPKAAKLTANMRYQIGLLPKPPSPVPALIVLNDSGTSVVGRGNYLNDLLEAAGGTNVITAVGYVAIDHEKMQSLKPAEVFLLMPGATEAMIETASKSIDVDALRKGGHLHVLTDVDALLPGANVVRLAQQFSAGLGNK